MGYSDDSETGGQAGFEDPSAGDVYKGFCEAKAHRVNIGWDAKSKKAENFYFCDPWESSVKETLLDQNRSPAVINEVLPAVELIRGHHIEMQSDLVVKPVDRVADPYIAKFFTQGVKQVDQSNDMGFEETAQILDGLITGVGDVDLWWDTDETVEGKLRAEQKPPWDYYFDKYFRKYGYTDASVLYREAWLSRQQISDIYGKDAVKNIVFPLEGADGTLPSNTVEHGYDEYTDYGNAGGHSEPIDERNGVNPKKRLIRVIEEYKQIREEYELYYDDDGGDWEDAESLPDEYRELVKDSIVKKKRKKIILNTLIGSKLVQKEEDTGAQEFYHLFNLYFPYFFNGRYMGMVEPLFYPQEEINKRHSTLVHILSTLGTNKVLYTDEFMDEDGEAEMADDWGKTGKSVKVNALEDEYGHATYKIIEPPQIPPVFERDQANQSEVIKHISGTPDQMAGAAQRRQSGAAKRQDVERGAIRLAGMIENYRKTQRLRGKAYIYWMQKYYTEERFIRIHGERLGETDQEVTLNKQALGFIANDITVGEYDVVIDSEAKTPTERDRAYWQLIELANNVPSHADLIGEEALKNSPLTEKDEIIRKWQERTQQVQEQQAMQGAAPAGGGGGVRRMPQKLQ